MSSSTADPLADIRRRAPVEGAWLVGGSVRDMLLGRPVVDIDLVVAEDPRTVARRLAGECGGSPFPLSERHGAWRVVSGEQTIDIAGCRGSIEHDLGLRDFTVNAIAVSLDNDEFIDPHGGARRSRSASAADGVGWALPGRPAAAAAAAADRPRAGFRHRPVQRAAGERPGRAGVAAVRRTHLHGDETPAGRGSAGGGAAADRSRRRARGRVARASTRSTSIRSRSCSSASSTSRRSAKTAACSCSSPPPTCTPGGCAFSRTSTSPPTRCWPRPACR